MSEHNQVMNHFFELAKEAQVIWALQDKNGEDWVILDSTQFEETEVMPLWSSEQAAQAHCHDEWADYQAASISVAEWLEYWIDDLKEDNIVIGLDWPTTDDELLELELSEFSQQLADIEKL